MKNFLCLFLLVSFSAGASTLENFFGALEGRWTSTSADSYRETTDGEISHSAGTKFEALVERTGNRWTFTEESCWQSEGEEPSCGKSELAYVVEGDALSIEMEGKSYPVDILEMADDFLTLTLSTEDYVFMAVITREGKVLTQNGVMEFADGTKLYQLLDLIRQ